jgi:hypothetical protein
VTNDNPYNPPSEAGDKAISLEARIEELEKWKRKTSFSMRLSTVAMIGITITLVAIAVYVELSLPE